MFWVGDCFGCGMVEFGVGCWVVVSVVGCDNLWFLRGGLVRISWVRCCFVYRLAWGLCLLGFGF